MKRKLISVGLALMLALSLGLVTSLPVAASDLIVGDAYGTIQAAVTAAKPGDTIIVYAGTYPEDVLIDKNLTLEGVQVGVDARGRTGGESELVGSFKVVSPADNVTIDGFTITGTGAGPLAGVCMRTEVADVTIANNIIVAVEATGGYTYSGLVDLDGITDALVEFNSLSGAYESDRAPNAVRLGITGAGTVTVANNEMSEVGGGGGIGIMCTNEDAMINIVDNDINQTGDGLWVWQNPSVFDTLYIADNTIHHNNAYHGAQNENTDTGVKLVGTINGVVVIEDNYFHDNTIQVDNSAGVVDLEDLLANNTFDQAVIVDNPGESLLPFIWSSIQDAVDAAVIGNLVSVQPGVYDEDVIVSLGIRLLSAVEHEAIVEGTIVVDNDGVDVVGFSIRDFSQVPTPDWSAIYIPRGTGVTVSNNLIDGVDIDPVANLTVGIHTLYGASAGVTLEGNVITNVRLGIYNQGAEMLIVGNTIDGAAHCGIGVDTDLGTEIIRNNIINNVVGIEVFRNNVVAHFNNIHGNSEYGVYLSTVYGATSVDAINNYWCSASGPTRNPGCGDRVSDDVLYDPWLLEPVVLGEEPVTYDKTLTLQDGWTLVSTDGWIDTAESVWVGDEEEVLIAYTYTVSGGYVEAELTSLVPVDAMYVKTDGCGGIGIIYSDSYAAASLKDLEAGWNLISSATHDSARAVLSPLRYVDVGEEQGYGLATLVSQGEYNQHSGNFYLATLGLLEWAALGHRDLNPFDGYWVYMNADKSFGVIPQ